MTDDPIQIAKTNENEAGRDPGRKSSWFSKLRALTSGRNGDSPVRDTLEELIEEHEERVTPIDTDERTLIENILRVGEKTALDVMVPRADIDAIEVGTSLDELVAQMVRQPHSRYPVYRDTLDDVLGFIHIKDVLKAQKEPSDRFSIRSHMRKALFVAPSMRVLDLLLQMRLTRTHMALIVDEYGGIDGLITIEDLVEQIVGEIEDEHDVDDRPRIVANDDGSFTADARVTLEDLVAEFGALFGDIGEEEDIDTLGGLVAVIAGRVPTRGELIKDEATSIEFEVLDADPRRVRKVIIRNLPAELPQARAAVS